MEHIERVVGMGAAAKDQATVTAAGESLRPVIDGVRTKRHPVHIDHRGRLMEIVNGDDSYWDEPIVYSYMFTVRRGLVKGWGIHEHKRDRYCLVSGEMLVVLWDGRPGSPTYGVEQAVVMSPAADQLLTIPTGVWHLDLNVGPEECLLLNHPTRPYRHDDPDRWLLPWNTPEIPVDVSRYFPPQYAR